MDQLGKAMVFPVVMYGCKSWAIKRLNTEELMLEESGENHYTIQL